MPLNIQVPQVGLANATEEPKLAGDMTQLAVWANGNIADSDLSSPNNTFRRLLLTASALVDRSTPTGDLIFTSQPYPIPSGAACDYPALIWVGDGGLSGQPRDFQVQNKTAIGRVRASLAASALLTGVTVTPALYQVTAIGGGSGGVSYTFSGAFPGSAVALAAPAAGFSAVESGEFGLPTGVVAYALGVNLSAQLPAGTALALTAQLYAYSI